MERTFFEKFIQCSDYKDIREIWRIIGGQPKQLRAHNMIVGIPMCGDTVLYQHIINKDLVSTSVRRTQLISYPPPLARHSTKAFITGFAIIDMTKDGSGGDAVIERGGIGTGFVDIKLTSKLFNGLSLCLVIVGKHLEQLQEVNEKLTTIKEQLKQLNEEKDNDQQNFI